MKVREFPASSTEDTLDTSELVDTPISPPLPATRSPHRGSTHRSQYINKNNLNSNCDQLVMNSQKISPQRNILEKRYTQNNLPQNNLPQNNSPQKSYPQKILPEKNYSQNNYLEKSSHQSRINSRNGLVESSPTRTSHLSTTTSLIHHNQISTKEPPPPSLPTSYTTPPQNNSNQNLPSHEYSGDSHHNPNLDAIDSKPNCTPSPQYPQHPPNSISPTNSDTHISRTNPNFDLKSNRSHLPDPLIKSTLNGTLSTSPANIQHSHVSRDTSPHEFGVNSQGGEYHLSSPNEEPEILNGQDKSPANSSSADHRYYHVFKRGELVDLVNRIKDLNIIKDYYDHANWCVIVERI